jgi:HEPN domain-containing protein
MKKLTREWIRKAEDDFRTAQILAAGAALLHDQVCFHCQQCAEKYLNARLSPSWLAFPHGLAVDPRYPLLRTTKRQATSALRWAGKVRDACRILLGL